jgi:HptB-dependent secretion and biofilm anti anti-sigma factor
MAVVISNETGTIHLGGRFTFLDQSDFENLCKNISKNEQVKQIIVDLEKVKHIDSSALGMLLVLRDHTRAIGASLVLSGPNGSVLRAMNVAHFAHMFNIQ